MVSENVHWTEGKKYTLPSASPYMITGRLYSDISTPNNAVNNTRVIHKSEEETGLCVVVVFCLVCCILATLLSVFSTTRGSLVFFFDIASDVDCNGPGAE